MSQLAIRLGAAPEKFMCRFAKLQVDSLREGLRAFDVAQRQGAQPSWGCGKTPVGNRHDKAPRVLTCDGNSTLFISA